MIQYVLDHWNGDECSAKSFEVLPLIFITDCSPIVWLQSVLKIRSKENFFLSFLNFFQASRFGGRVDHLIHPPPHVLYSGTNSTSEVPVSGFGGWILGGGSLNFGPILKKEKKRNTFSKRLIFSSEVSPIDWLQSALKIRHCATFFVKLWRF